MIVCKDLCPVYERQMCCALCEERNDCLEVCDVCTSGNSNTCELRVETADKALTVAEEKALPIMQTIKAIVLQKKELEAKEKALKEKLKAAMEEYGVKSFDNDLLKVTYIAPTTTTKVDFAKLKKKFPDVYAECSKSSSVSAYIKVEVKGE